MKCSIRSLVGEYCMTMEDGKRVFKHIRPELALGRPVELDFGEVRVWSWPTLPRCQNLFTARVER